MPPAAHLVHTVSRPVPTLSLVGRIDGPASGKMVRPIVWPIALNQLSNLSA